MGMTAERLSDTVGAEVKTSTTPRRSPSARSWAGSRSSARGQHPEIFQVVLDPTRYKGPSDLRGTFDWHIDGMTEDVQS